MSIFVRHTSYIIDAFIVNDGLLEAAFRGIVNASRSLTRRTTMNDVTSGKMALFAARDNTTTMRDTTVRVALISEIRTYINIYCASASPKFPKRDACVDSKQQLGH